jgi:hypothetical protein
MNNILHFYTENSSWLGDVATWISGTGIFLTFIIGFVQINNERRFRKEKERREQAEHISAFIYKETQAKTTIALLNLSSEPVYEVIVSISVFHAATNDQSPKIPHRYTSFLSVVPPGKSYTFVNGGYQGFSFHPAIEIAFKDVKGKSWVRSARGALREIRKSPVDYYKIQHTLHWQLPVHE